MLWTEVRVGVRVAPGPNEEAQHPRQKLYLRACRAFATHPQAHPTIVEMNPMVAHAATIDPSKQSGIRRRRAKVCASLIVLLTIHTSLQTDAPPSTAAEPSIPSPSTTPLYYVHQYAGLVLCIISAVGTGWVSHQEWSDTHTTVGIFGFLVLAAVALVFHELRPFVGPTFHDIHTFKQQQAEAAAKRD